MKLDQQQQAKNLYFQTDLSKTQIADEIGVSRRALHYWIRQNNWDRIKQNAEHIPSILAENCYQMMGGLMDAVLSPERTGYPITPQEANAIYKLTLTIKQLKARSAINEQMEHFRWLVDDIAEKDYKLAQEVTPYIENYITCRTAAGRKQYKEAMTTPIRNTVLHDESLGDMAHRRGAITDEIFRDFADEDHWEKNGFTPETEKEQIISATPDSEPLPKQTRPASSAPSHPHSHSNPLSAPHTRTENAHRSLSPSPAPANPSQHPAAA